MRLKKKVAFVLIMGMMIFAMSGCGKEEVFEESVSNFYKDEYYPEKKHKEYEIEMPKGCKTMIVQATATSGTFHLVIANEDEANMKWEYEVDGPITETIEIKRKHLDDNWMYYVDVNEDTDGSVKLQFKK